MDRKGILRGDRRPYEGDRYIGVETTLGKALLAFGERKVEEYFVRQRDVSDEFLQYNGIKSFSLRGIKMAIKDMKMNRGKGDR